MFGKLVPCLAVLLMLSACSRSSATQASAASSAPSTTPTEGKATQGNALVTWEEYQQKIAEAKVPVVVDFSAVWCGPCKVLAPTVGELEKEWAGRAEFYQVDIDKSPQISKQLQIRGVPTLIFYAKGNEVRRLVGVRPRAELEAALKEAAGKVK